MVTPPKPSKTKERNGTQEPIAVIGSEWELVSTTGIRTPDEGMIAGVVTMSEPSSRIHPSDQR